MKRAEHALQIAVAHMLRVVLDPNGTWWTAIDHGVGKLGVVEAVNRKNRGVKPGLPDFIILLKRTHPYGAIGIELKSAKGVVSEAQRDVAADWRDLDHSYELARSLEDVQDILVRYRVPVLRHMNFLGGGYERSERPAPLRYKRPPYRRKSKNHLPLVLAHAAQKK